MPGLVNFSSHSAVPEQTGLGLVSSGVLASVIPRVARPRFITLPLSRYCEKARWALALGLEVLAPRSAQPRQSGLSVQTGEGRRRACRAGILMSDSAVLFI